MHTRLQNAMETWEALMGAMDTIPSVGYDASVLDEYACRPHTRFDFDAHEARWLHEAGVTLRAAPPETRKERKLNKRRVSHKLRVNLRSESKAAAVHRRR